ncbi:MAG: ribonuclease III [Lachnospiraceae bacterium]|nr:ribonuclease III [Lachnospiraceae bacterium]
MRSTEEFQEKIGYKFKQPGLLRQALTHSSYANEKRMKKGADNERLEFLGDAVLEVVSSEYLFKNYPSMPEGDMTKLRASLVCEPTLADCAVEISLGDFLYLGKGEDKTGGRERKSVLSDALEATIGAIFLDGGFTNAKEFILKFIMTDIEHKKLFHDSKTILQEVAQGEFGENVTYELVGESGPDHSKTYKMRVLLKDRALAEGEGKNKKSAEQEAAYKALLVLDKELGIER